MEFGSWDPQLSAMVNITYAGTRLTNGQPDNSTACTTFFDQIGFIMGTSTRFFNVSAFILATRLSGVKVYTRMHQVLDVVHQKIKGFDKNSTKGILYLLLRLLDQFPSSAVDVAIWPNVRSLS